MSDPITAQSIEISRDGDFVRLTFRDEHGAASTVSLHRTHIGSFVARLTSEIEDSKVTRIDHGSLRPGQNITIQGWQVEKHPSGSRRLVLIVELPNPSRVVMIPMTMPADEVGDLIQQLR